jgi:molybdate transport system substrate-binding protein
MYLNRKKGSRLCFVSWRNLVATAVLLCSVLVLGIAGGPVSAQPAVAAASDLKFALEEIATQYRQETGQSLRLVFGSSGNLTTQILQGAPFDIVLSADEALTRKLHVAGLTTDPGVIYGRGRLVLYLPKGSELRADEELKGLEQGLKAGQVRRLAIANPEHAPYGQRAVQVLKGRGLWDLAKPKLVLGENVTQAASFAATGNAQAALIAWSLVLAPPLSQEGQFALVSEAMHEPLLQSMALLKKAGPSARAFYAYLQQDSAKAILARYGFRAPV